MKRLLPILCLLATVCRAKVIQPGGESFSGTDSAQCGRLYGPNSPNPTWLRVNYVTWKMIEVRPGAYDFTAFDKLMWFCAPTNWPSIGWPGPVPPQPKLMWNITTPPPFYTNQRSYIIGEGNLIKAVLARYPNAFTWLEPVNEPDGGCNWLPGCSNVQQNADFTTRLIRACGSVAKSVQPSILIAGPSNTNPEDLTWNLYFDFSVVDVVTWHEYRMNSAFAGGPQYSPYDSIPGQLLPFELDCATMRYFAQGRSMMITECSLGSVNNAATFPILAQKNGVTGIALVGIMAPGPLSFWDWQNNCLAPNGLAFSAAINAINRRSP
jgi:hypothetical protein